MTKNFNSLVEEWKGKFRAEYRVAYAGILPDEMLERGNPWLEAFLKQAMLASAKGAAEAGASVPLPEYSRVHTSDIRQVSSTELTLIKNAGWNAARIDSANRLNAYFENHEA